MDTNPAKNERPNLHQYLQDSEARFFFDRISGIYKPKAHESSCKPSNKNSYPKGFWITTLISAFTFIAVAIYAWYAALQWCEMVKATKATEKAAIAADSAATTASKALKASDRSFKIEERAYVATTFAEMANPPVITKSANTVSVCVDVHAANSGKTPAVGFRLYRYATYGENAEKTIRTMKVPVYPVPDGGLLGNVGDQRGTAVSSPVDQTTAQKLINADDAVYIYGIVQYFDIFGDYHETGFCYQRVLHSNAFIGCGFGNWFDKRPAS